MFFFFFQAEDGIRDLTVTGVQTCALPIFQASASVTVKAAQVSIDATSVGLGSGASHPLVLGDLFMALFNRSEERRVGKSVDLGGRRIIKKKKNKNDSIKLQIHIEKNHTEV